MIDFVLHFVLLCAAHLAAYHEGKFWYSGPRDASALYSSTAEQFGQDINMRVEEVERRPKVSVIRVFSEGHGKGLGAAIYGHRAILELAGLRGFRYAVALGPSRGLSDLRFAYRGREALDFVELTVGFTDDSAPDIAAEFPEYASSGVGKVYRREDLDWIRRPPWLQVMR